MRKLGIVAVVGLTVMFAACDLDLLIVVSLHPLVSEKESAEEPGLVGTWVNEDESEALRFTPRKEGGYEMVVLGYEQSEEGVKEVEKEKYQCRPAWLGKYLFLDLVEQKDSSSPFSVPMHVPVRADLWRDEIHFAEMDGHWLAKQIEEKRVDVPHVVMHDTWIVLTAPTQELQEFFSRHSWDDEAFPDGSLYRRKQEGLPK